jgi:hypothetical protein
MTTYVDEYFIGDKDDTEEIIQMKKRIVNKISKLDGFFEDGTLKSFDSDMLDQDMLTVGKIDGSILTIEINTVKIGIDLSMGIKHSLKNKDERFVTLLLDNNIDLYKLEKNTLIMCLNLDNTNLMGRLINLKFPIDIEDHRVLFQSVSKGYLEIVKLMILTYELKDNYEIAAKICVNAIIHNKLNILSDFFPKSVFRSVPDFRTLFIQKCILYADLDMLKYLLDDDYDIAQSNYRCVHIAIEHSKHVFIKYFMKLDNHVLSLLSHEDQIKYGPKPTAQQNDIGQNKSCNIYYNDIMYGDEYYMCKNGDHYFMKDAWEKWILKKKNRKCPHCPNNVKKDLFINTKLVTVNDLD